MPARKNKSTVSDKSNETTKTVSNRFDILGAVEESTRSKVKKQSQPKASGKGKKKAVLTDTVEHTEIAETVNPVKNTDTQDSLNTHDSHDNHNTHDNANVDDGFQTVTYKGKGKNNSTDTKVHNQAKEYDYKDLKEYTQEQRKEPQLGNATKLEKIINITTDPTTDGSQTQTEGYVYVPPNQVLDPRGNNNDEENNRTDNGDNWDDGFKIQRRKQKNNGFGSLKKDGFRNNRNGYDRSDRNDYGDMPSVSDKTIEYYDQTLTLVGDDMKLNSSWTVWIHENANSDWSLNSYKSIYTINSIGNMWRFLHVLNNLDKKPRQYYIMRDGVTPIWEDNNNKQGGICSILIENMNKSQDVGADAFTAICILVLNESFVRKNNIVNGLCYSIKNGRALIKLWFKDYENNKNFQGTLPIALLTKIEELTCNYDNRGFSKQKGRPSVSVQVKQITPNY